MAKKPLPIPFEMIQAFCKDYEYVGIFNSTYNQMEQIYVGSLLEADEHSFALQRNYDDLFQCFTQKLIQENEKELFLFECRFEYVKEHLEKHPSYYSGSYQIKNDPTHHVRIKFVKLQEGTYLFSVIQEGQIQNQLTQELFSFLSEDDFQINMELESMRNKQAG